MESAFRTFKTNDSCFFQSVQATYGDRLRQATVRFQNMYSDAYNSAPTNIELAINRYYQRNSGLGNNAFGAGLLKALQSNFPTHAFFVQVTKDLTRMDHRCYLTKLTGLGLWTRWHDSKKNVDVVALSTEYFEAGCYVPGQTVYSNCNHGMYRSGVHYSWVESHDDNFIQYDRSFWNGCIRCHDWYGGTVVMIWLPDSSIATAVASLNSSDNKTDRGAQGDALAPSAARATAAAAWHSTDNGTDPGAQGGATSPSAAIQV